MSRIDVERWGAGPSSGARRGAEPRTEVVGVVDVGVVDVVDVGVGLGASLVTASVVAVWQLWRFVAAVAVL
ncbi:hypothetical protein PZB75_14080 [Streptomyces sp. AM 4-1-1]|uniref:hypothetical protein n=1 Tax=Streptomyces sp. AM 4-1-1 TaxID=3028710 RepID=UPI0023B9ED1E|nr:hypothetical protein [Streptomyces sp. AM 4-1-1]WEH34380.1 hypothetical protein PZB75_14080 [Streptomyces sp. AM 4-1-1]